MDFMQTQTCQNLARSFAGESQARQRYTQYAQKARKEGFEYLARLFEQTAGNEQAHAQEFLEKLQKYGRQPIENIDFSAGYPYTLGVTMENLLEAAKGENEETTRVYPNFAKTAREEGYADAASIWENTKAFLRMTANVESGGDNNQKEHMRYSACINAISVSVSTR